MWAIAGDESFQMCIKELATVVQEQLPIKIAVVKRGCSRIQSLSDAHCDSVTGILGPDLVRIAAAYGIPGLMVQEETEVGPTIEAAVSTDGPILVVFRLTPEPTVAGP